jgi:hypothetical protein
VEDGQTLESDWICGWAGGEQVDSPPNVITPGRAIPVSFAYVSTDVTGVVRCTWEIMPVAS